MVGETVKMAEHFTKLLPDLLPTGPLLVLLLPAFGVLSPPVVDADAPPLLFLEKLHPLLSKVLVGGVILPLAFGALTALCSSVCAQTLNLNLDLSSARTGYLERVIEQPFSVIRGATGIFSTDLILEEGELLYVLQTSSSRLELVELRVLLPIYLLSSQHI